MKKPIDFICNKWDDFEDKIEEVILQIEDKIEDLKNSNIYWKILFILLLPVKWILQILWKCICWGFYVIGFFIVVVIGGILGILGGVIYKIMCFWWFIYIFNIGGPREAYPVGSGRFIVLVIITLICFAINRWSKKPMSYVD